MVDSPYQLVQDFFHQQKPLKISLSSKGRLLSSSPINFQERAVRFRVIFRGLLLGKKRNFIFRHALPGGGYVALRIRLYVLRKGLITPTFLFFSVGDQKILRFFGRDPWILRVGYQNQADRSVWKKSHPCVETCR